MLGKQQEEQNRRGMDGLFASLARTRWSYAVVLSLVFAAMLVAAFQSYRAIDRELTDITLSRRAAVAQLAAATLSEKLERLVDIAVSLATRVRFRQLVAEGEWLEAIEILRDVPRDFPFTDRLVLLDTAGTVMADIPEQLEVRGKNFAYRDWYQGVSRDWKPYVSTVYRRAAAPQSNVFAVAVPIRRQSGGEVAGILLLQTRLDAYFEWIREADVGPGGFVYVVDHKGQVAFHPKFPAQGTIVELTGVPVVQRVLRGDRGIEIAYDPIEKEEAISAYAPVPKYGWGVIVRQPTRTAFEARDDQLGRLLIAYGLILLLFVLGIYLASRIIVQRRQADADRRMKAELEQNVAERTAQLRESREQFRAVTETANDAIVSADSNGNIIYFNQAASEIFGHVVDEAIGQPLTLLMPASFHAAHRAGLKRFLSGQPSTVVGKTVELAGRRKDGTEFPLELSLASWRTSAGVFFTGIIRDITERKEAEKTLKRTNEELSVANKELEGFSYSVSHDLRAPLRAIDGFSRILTEDYGDRLDDEARRLLGVVRGNSRKMGELIDDLLEFSRLGRKELSTTTIDMKRLAEVVIGELQMSGERSPRLVLGTLPPASGDAILVKQAWANLLGNAVKFSSKREQPVIEVSGSMNGMENVYCVKDNGAGFDMRYYDKLFGVFQRLHSAEEFEGTGVGLAIVQCVIARHGGRVWAEGEVGKGATFYFSLPRGKSDGQI